MPQDPNTVQTTVNQAAETEPQQSEKPSKTPALVDVFSQRVGSDILGTAATGGRLGAGLGLLGGLTYTFSSPERRRKWLKNMLLYGGLGFLGGGFTGGLLGSSFGRLYALQRIPSHVEALAKEHSKSVEEIKNELAAASDSLRLLLDPKERTILFRHLTFPAAGAGLGFLAGTAFALSTRERRKEWFKNLLIYSTLGTLTGAISVPIIGGFLFPPRTNQ